MGRAARYRGLPRDIIAVAIQTFIYFKIEFFAAPDRPKSLEDEKPWPPK